MASNGSKHAKLEKLLTAIKEGKKLVEVDLSNCGLTEVPEEIYNIRDSVEVINLGGNRLSSLPDWISDLDKLRILFFANNAFRSIPLVLGKMKSLYMLSFKSNQLETIDGESLSPTIGWLILTDNNFTEVPASIGRLSKLRKLMLAGNQLSALPQEMQECKELELVRIAANKMVITLPPWLLKMPKLSWLAFAQSQSQSVAASSYTGITDGNKGDVASAPAAAAVGGSRGGGGGVGGDIPEITWQSLSIKDKLGEGASGVIYRATWKKTRRPSEINGSGSGSSSMSKSKKRLREEKEDTNDDSTASCGTDTTTATAATTVTAAAITATITAAAAPYAAVAGGSSGEALLVNGQGGDENDNEEQEEGSCDSEVEVEVAVKLFKGGKTSDGLPEDEMRASASAGDHPCSLVVLGRIVSAPDNQLGLVLPLIPPEFKILGGPPSFDTVTRDTFPAGKLFSLKFVMRVLCGIASVCAHLHHRGIAHGDIYAHNILVTDEGAPLLSDFGAASFYDRNDGSVAAAIEGFEVRAFGCLMEDLLERLSPDAHTEQLHCDTRQSCSSSSNDDGPYPADVVIESLGTLKNECFEVDSRTRPRFEEIYDRLIVLGCPAPAVNQKLRQFTR